MPNGRDTGFSKLAPHRVNVSTPGRKYTEFACGRRLTRQAPPEGPPASAGIPAKSMIAQMYHNVTQFRLQGPGMRQILLMSFTILIFSAAGAAVGRAQAFQTKAPYALLIDYNTGTVLFQKNADLPMAPASTTKILTAEIIFGELAGGRLRLDDTMPISAKAAREGDAETGGSSMFAQVNTRVLKICSAAF